MKSERAYTHTMSPQHIKALGQYFTNYRVADFMCSWACRNATSMLDPAVGNSVFFKYVQKYNPCCQLTGYEIDSHILQYFCNPTGAAIINKDYLLNGWDDKYDTIICNPPYNKFQAVNNHDEIINAIEKHTGIKYSGYTNLYVLFLIKSIYQLSDTGRLAYVVPSEFLNSKYGTAIKQLMIDRKLLRAIINFENDDELFFNATTTSCIILLDHEPKTHVLFYGLSSIDELKNLTVGQMYNNSLTVAYKELKADKKWRAYLNQEKHVNYTNLTAISDYCLVSRGIATGANEFFCFSLTKAKEHGIPPVYLTKCVCRSADIKTPIFTDKEFELLSKADKTVYLLDIGDKDITDIAAYISYGEKNKINKKYLPSCRTPWYSMEEKKAAPILVTSACRGTIKFIRNIAMIKSLTTFHSIFIKEPYVADTDLIFCYFLTPIAQTIVRENRKKLGNGLNKFQPGDLNNAKMLDIRIISPKDKTKIFSIYEEMKLEIQDSHINQLNNIFSCYLLE